MPFDGDDDVKRRLVGLPFDGNGFVAGKRAPVQTEPVLKRRLGVECGNVGKVERRDLSGENTPYGGGGGSDAAIEIKGCHDGLEGIFQKRRLVASALLLLIAAEAEGFTQPDALGGLGQLGGSHEVPLGLGQITFAGGREPLDEPRTDDEPQYGIAKEFEAFVVGVGGCSRA